MNQPKLYVAIDTPNAIEACERADRVNHVRGDFGYKLNLDLILRQGIAIVDRFRRLYGRPIFADIKAWNGGRTMAEIAVALGQEGAALTNLYVQAGEKLIGKVVEAVAKDGHRIDVYGVGVLTHYTDRDCRGLYNASLPDMVEFFAEGARTYGLDGYIQAGTLLDVTSGLGLPRLVPAARPAWFEETKANDQEQTVTPTEALRGGARIVVCGSPIFKSPNHAEALRRILAEIDDALPKAIEASAPA